MILNYLIAKALSVLKYFSHSERSCVTQHTQSLLNTRCARRSSRRCKLAYLHPLPNTCSSFLEDVTHCPLFHIHIHWLPTLSPRAGRVPLPLLDLLFSLVRVRLMPLSMLIVHCSKAAFIKMIKCSQTPAEYLKASGRTTWQVTTSHANTPILPLQLQTHWLPVDACGYIFFLWVSQTSNETF